MLLPLLDEEPLYNSLVFDDSADWQSGAPNETACNTLVSTFFCPTAPITEQVNNSGIPNVAQASTSVVHQEREPTMIRCRIALASLALIRTACFTDTAA